MKTSLQQQFTAAVKAGDLPAQVVVARSAARHLLMHDGLDTEEELQQVQALAGEFPKTDDLDAWEAFCRQLKAAYALGIAIGQLVHLTCSTKAVGDERPRAPLSSPDRTPAQDAVRRPT